MTKIQSLTKAFSTKVKEYLNQNPEPHMTLHIITPCSRPENIAALQQSVNRYAAQAIHHICFDTSKVQGRFATFTPDRTKIYTAEGGVSGNLQRNTVIQALKATADPMDWLFVLDDDNLLHPNFMQLLHQPELQDRRCNILTFDQELEHGVIRKGNDTRVGYIDQAQFMIRLGLQEEYEQDYNADGILISRLIAKNLNSWLYLPRTYSYYNRLRWNHE